jgi:hypothetical protein
MTTPYSNREIDTYFKEIKESLDRIEKQTTKTNGRVSKLEHWRSALAGAWLIIMLIVAPLIARLMQII